MSSSRFRPAFMTSWKSCITGPYEGDSADDWWVTFTVMHSFGGFFLWDSTSCWINTRISCDFGRHSAHCDFKANRFIFLVYCLLDAAIIYTNHNLPLVTPHRSIFTSNSSKFKRLFFLREYPQLGPHLTEISWISMGIGTWITNYIHVKSCDVITHSRPITSTVEFRALKST